MASASSRVTMRFAPTMPPNAETESHMNARRYALVISLSDAMQQGFWCLIIATVGVEGGLLVRVLAVAKVADLAQRERELVRGRDTRFDGEPRGDHRVVCGRVREGLCGQRAPRLERDRAALRELVDHGPVPLTPRDGDDVLVILR